MYIPALMYMPDTCPNTYQIHSYILNQVQEYQAEENHSMKQVPYHSTGDS